MTNRHSVTTHDRIEIRKKFGVSKAISSSFQAAYDLDGDGKMDAIEQVMMKYDTDGNGEFSNEEVFHIIHDHLEAERKAARFRRMAVGLAVFVSVLVVCNLGTSYAAMALAKDLTVDGDVMMVKGSGGIASVQTATETMDMTPLTDTEFQQRKLLVLSDLESDPHSHPHRRLKKNKCKNEDVICDGDLVFDHGKIPESMFRVIEQKCKRQQNVKIRRAREFDRQADSICSAGTSVVVKQKKGGKKNKNNKKGKDKVTVIKNPMKRMEYVDREVIITNSAGARLNVDCVDEDCFISGDLLLGGYGESCNVLQNDCRSHLICEKNTGKNSKLSSTGGTCIFPRFTKLGSDCDMGYHEESCAQGLYCFSDVHRIHKGDGALENSLVGHSGSIRLDSKNPRFKLGTKIGECIKQVGIGSLCDSPYACIDKYMCIGAGGIEIGGHPHGSGEIQGPSATLRWNVQVEKGQCM